MKILAFRHVPFEHLGRIQAVLEARGLGFDYADLYLDSAPQPSPAAYAGLIFMGGPMSVNDGLPYLEREMNWIRRAADRGQPILGVCLGAQLIAKALGGRVYPNAVKEIGWFDIEMTPAGARDPLFAEAGPRETVFHWHGETFDPPPGSLHLSQSAVCRQQAFRLGASVYGLQFHLEATPAMITDWCEQDANCSDVRELRQPVDPFQNSARLDALSRSVFAKWCDLLPAAPGHAGPKR